MIDFNRDSPCKIGFGLPGAGLSARAIFDVTMAHLAADFANVTDTAAVLNS